MKSQERESLLSGVRARCCAGRNGRRASAEVGREGARRRGAERHEGFARGRSRARGAASGATRGTGRVSRRGENARGACARRGGRRASEYDGDPNGRNSRVEDGDRATHHMRPPTERALRGERGVGRRRRGPGATATLLKLDARRRNMATRRLRLRQSRTRPSARVRVGRRRGADCPTGTSVLAGGYARFGATYGRSGPGSRREFAFARWVRNGTFETSKTEITFRLLPFKYLDDEHSDGSSSGDRPSVAPQSI